MLEGVKIATLSEPQRKMLRFLKRNDGRGWVQVAGHGAAPMLSAAHALVRKGLAATGPTGRFALTDTGRPIATALLEEFNATKAKTPSP